MRLENIAIVLRPRSAWEAIDLGYAMAQQWWTPLMKAWCAVYLPAALIINLLCWKLPWLAVMILWWLKPAFDRVVLHVLSGAVFGATPPLRETLSALKRLWWKNGLFAALTYARFNPARSFTLPVVQLEGGRGKLAAKRRRVLAREGSGAAIGLTVMSIFTEVTMLFSVYLLANLFSPGEPVFGFSWQSMMNPEKDLSAQYLSNALNAVVISILEPFYVAAGFAIYLNCRTAIEGWDVELQFKRMAARMVAASATPAVTRSAPIGSQVIKRVERAERVERAARAAAVMLAAGLAFAVVPADHAFAQTVAERITQTPTPAPSPAPAPAPAEEADAGGTCRPGDELPADADGGGDGDAKSEESKSDSNANAPSTGAAQAAKKVLASKDFGEYKETWQIKYVGPTWGGWNSDKPKQKTDIKWLLALAEFFAKSARVIAWIGGAILVLVLIYLIARQFGIKGWGAASRRDAPDVLFGLDVRPESLPDNLADAARKLLAAGDTRGAISLMYRGALVSLIQDGQIDIARGDTELELVARVRRVYVDDAGGVAKVAYFANLVSIWQRVAYARQTVNPSEIAPLIDEWSSHFNIRRSAAMKPPPVTTSLAAAQ